MRLWYGRSRGYQFVGRTLQMWNRYHEVADFAGKPRLLRVFDQLRFYPVSADELQQIRRDFPLGRYPLRIEHSTLRLAEYQQFLQREAVSIDAFRQHQQRAFNEERERWIASGRAHFDSQEVAADAGDEARAARTAGRGESDLRQSVASAGRRGESCSRRRRSGGAGVNENGDPAVGAVRRRGATDECSAGASVRAGQRVAVITEENV